MEERISGSGAAAVAVLFADIVDSSLLYATSGNTVAFTLTTECVHIMIEEVRRVGGRALKRIGDSIMAVFDHVDSAVDAAEAIQKVMAQSEPGAAHDRLRVHIGISAGPAVVTEGDVFGDVVNVAARLEKQAGPGEIILSGQAYEGLSADRRRATQMLDEVVLHGRPSRMPIYRYLWKAEDATALAKATLQPQAAALHLRYQGRDFVVNADCPKLRVGRAADTDIVIGTDVVSRYHAEISMRGDKFFLHDSSRNGSYVRAGGIPAVRVAREECLLSEAGDIRLGAEDTAPIHYEVRRYR